MQQVLASEYIQAVKAIKGAIIQSRYRAAKKVNAEVLSLYYAVGRYISTFSRQAEYGTNALKIISNQLQQEMPGLQGFSDTNMKRMRKFYEEWCPIIEKRPPVADDLQIDIIPVVNQQITIRPLVADEFTAEEQQDFLSTPFNHHYELLVKTSSLDERMFYIHKCAREFWTKEHLIAQLKSDLYHSQAVTNNFLATIDDDKQREKAMRTFKQELVLDFLHIPDPDYVDELDVEDQIVKNIKNFIMAIGTDFTFMGNQYRLIVDGEESYIDLLFFNRRLRSLVAIELKSGKFQPEFAGKLNYYLSALDEYVKLPDENPSIGIILCRDMNEKKVEFTFRDMTKPMGVATYRSSAELPEQYRNILPTADELRKLL